MYSNYISSYYIHWQSIENINYTNVNYTNVNYTVLIYIVFKASKQSNKNNGCLIDTFFTTMFINNELSKSD